LQVYCHYGRFLQESYRRALNELRLLSSARLDSHLLLTVVLAGATKLMTPELIATL
jgi:type II secretory pathway predicted ATPase ExeA